MHGAEYGDSAHRDVRGIPFVFLKRSLADGECDIHDVQTHICNPDEGNEPHELILGSLILDIVFSLLTTSAVFALTTRSLRIRF